MPRQNGAKKRNAVNTLIKRLPTNVIYYGALFGAIYLTTRLPVPIPITKELTEFIKGVGYNLFSSLIDHSLKGGDISDDAVGYLTRMLEEFAETKEHLLSEERFFDAIRQLVQHQDIIGQNICDTLLAAINKRFDIVGKKLDTLDEKIDTLNEKVTVIVTQNPIPRVISTELNKPLPCNRVPRPLLFAGRTNELEKLAKALKAEQAVAITALRGIGGIGKTTLAQELAHHVGEDFGLRLYASLGKDFREDGIPHILRGWVGADFDPKMTLEDMLAETRRILTSETSDCGEQSLVIIDDVWLDSVKSARLLRQAIPLSTRILVTTRSKEVAQRLDCKSETLNFMPPHEGAALIIQRLDESDQAKATQYQTELEKLSEILQGHPLALKLAASRLANNFQHRTLQNLIEKLDDGMKNGVPIAELDLDVGDEKEDSVSVTLQLTYDNLGGSDPEHKALRQQQFRTLGALPADLPFRLEHLWAIWGKEDDTALANFVAEGLLERNEAKIDEEKPGEWYKQHRLLRAYARALLDKQGDLETISRRHFNMLETEHGDYGTNNNEDHHPRIRVDFEQIRAALNWGFEFEPQRTCDWVHALTYYLGLHEILSTRRALLQAAYTVALQIGYTQSEANTLQALGDLALREDDLSATRDFYQRALLQFQTVGARLGEANTLQALGDLALREDDLSAARDFYQRALLQFQTVGARLGEANTLKALGDLALREADLSAARDFYQRALLQFQTVADRLGEANTLQALGDLALREADLSAARDFYQRALLQFQTVGARLGEANTLQALGDLALREADLSAARDFYQRALLQFQTVADRLGEANTLQALGNLALREDDLSAARDFYQRALLQFQTVGARLGEANTLQALGNLAQQEQNWEAAMQKYTITLNLFRAIGDAYSEAVTCVQMYPTLVALNRVEEAIRGILFTHTTFIRIGLTMYLKVVEGSMQSLKQQVGPAVFDNAWQAVTDESQPDWLL